MRTYCYKGPFNRKDPSDTRQERQVRPGVRLGIDVGTVRIGVAASDPEGVLATPVDTVPRGRGDLDKIAELAAAHEAIEVILGFPRTLQGHEGQSAAYAGKFARKLSRILAPLTVRLTDERLSTAAAQKRLRESGVRGRRVRSVVDQEAAVMILQGALDFERATGQPPGRIVKAAE